MKILIISDTHGAHRNFDRVIEKEQPLDMLIHLGDVEGDEDYIPAVADCPVHMVRGNNDFFSGLPEVMQSLTQADTISDVKTTVADSQITCAFQVTINEVQQLEITLALSYPEHPGDEFYKITQWQTVTTNEPAADDTLHLFSGN